MSGKRRKAPRTSDAILLAMGFSAAAFIVAMAVIFCVKGSVPDTLIQYTLGTSGVEALLLAGIKLSKILTGDKPREGEDTSWIKPSSSGWGTSSV